MLTKKVDVEELRSKLENYTDVISVSIFFGENNQVGIKFTEGKVLYTTTERVYWKTYYKKKRTLYLTTFGQLMPGLNYGSTTFYGLFLKPNNMDKFYTELLVLAKDLRVKMLETISMLNCVVDKIENLTKDTNNAIKKISYIKSKINKLRGHDWLERPYHYAKGISLYEEWLLSKDRKLTIEYKRASNIFYKGRKQRIIYKYPLKIKRYQNWSGEKLYPRLFKKFFECKSPEYKVLKKDKWRL